MTIRVVQSERKRCSQPRLGDRRREGAVLVCVLVILLLVGLTTAQTTQTMLIARRSDEQRDRYLQAREVLELGKIAARRAWTDPNMQTTRELEWSLDLPAGQRARIVARRVEVDNSNQAADRVNLEVTYEFQSEDTLLVTDSFKL